MFKSKLQELCQKRGLTLPVYTSEKDGPGHCPRFTATVTVGGTLFHTPPTECRSSKEAQNSAARVAFEFLSAVPSGSGLAALPSLPQASSTTEAIGPAKEVAQQNNIGNVHSNDKFDVKPIELHLYKNRLQQYVQKNHLSLPIYASEHDGPPHCRRFKASVTVEGRTYHCSEYHPTLKDAEQAAAKVALESLSAAEIEESDGFFKSLLQQLVHKEGHQLPKYSTNRRGLSHTPTFVSTVEVGDLTFQGEECKTKKQSEISAAKIAYEKLNSLKVAPVELGKRIASPQDTPRETADENCHSVGAKMSPNNHKRTAGQVEEFSSIGANGTNGNGPAPILGRGVIDDDTLQNHNSEHAEKIEFQNRKAEGLEENAKRYKSSNEFMNTLPATLLPSPPLPNDSSSVPDVLVKHVEARLAEFSKNLDSKILIARHGSGIDVPEGASVVHNAEGWMAVKVNSEPDE